jgi:iron complex outermembrane receptor protein
MLKLFFTTFLSIPFALISQIKGVILDEKNQEPIAGVKITLSKGQKTQTNANGEYLIVPTKYPVQLNFSFFGYVDDSNRITKDTTFTKYLVAESIQIKTVVISAGRRSQEIEEVPISMEIIKPELINNKGLSNLEQAVDQTPGVYAMDGQVSIRGGGGYAYGAGSRVMLLWNGVPMLSPDIGDAKWNAIPMEQASQIEVLKGASSVLYGSGALNGIISLTEKEPIPQGKISVKLQSGIYGNPRRSSLKWWDKNPTFHLVDIYGGKAFKKVGASIGANMYLDSGYRQGESEKRFRINGSFYYRPEKFTKLRTGLSYNFQYQDVNNFILWKNDSNCYQPMDGTLNRQKAIRFNIDPYLKYIDSKNNKHYLRTRYYLVTTGNSEDYKDASFAQLFYTDYQFQKKLYAGVN